MIQLDDKETGTKKVYNALDLRSPEGEMLMSPLYLWAVFILLVSPLVINIVLIRSTNKVASAFKFLYTVIAITIAIIMEGYYFIRLGPLSIWFCDVEFYSVMKAARNSIPLVLAIFAQIISMSAVNMSADQYAQSRGKTFKLWPSIVLPILAFIAFVVLCFNLPSERRRRSHHCTGRICNKVFVHNTLNSTSPSFCIVLRNKIQTQGTLFGNILYLLLGWNINSSGYLYFGNCKTFPRHFLPGTYLYNRRNRRNVVHVQNRIVRQLC